MFRKKSPRPCDAFMRPNRTHKRVPNGTLCRNFHRPKRRAVVAVQVMVILTALLGFSALAIDTSYMWNIRADLQRTADASALAAASMLAGYDDPADRARDTAEEYVGRNNVVNGPVDFEVSNVTLGRAELVDGAYTFEEVPDEDRPDAIRVQLATTRSLFFAAILGQSHKTVTAEATALLMPRDIVIVADLSASHNDDSELGSYLTTTINIWDVWDALPGGSDSAPSLWTEDDLDGLVLEEDGFNLQSAGPGWGFMRQMRWGEETIDEDYEPNSDAGLIHLARYGSYPNDWSSADLENYLFNLTMVNNAHYTPDEVEEILDTGHHGSYSRYQRQVAVALGLAQWNSGKPGGAWQTAGTTPGDGDDRIDSNELTWIEPFFDRPDPGSNWLGYIGQVASSSSRSASTNSHFRYNFGMKTLTNYLLENRWEYSDMPELAMTPHQPMQAVKDAAEMMVDFMTDYDNDDQLGLVVYGETVHNQVELQMGSNIELVTNGPDGLSGMQAGHYDGWTNAGGGLEAGIDMVLAPPGRSAAHKMIVFLTDGNANVRENGDTPADVPWWDRDQLMEDARDYVTDQAARAASEGIRVFAVSVGAYADTELMQNVADLTNGEHLEATDGDVATYSAQLQEIFVRLGGHRPVELIN